MKILVTGSSGTIGTRLCEVLMKNHEVVGIDWKNNKWNQAVEAITKHMDLREPLKLEGNFDAIVHFAANARVYDLVVDPNLARDNFLTTFNVLEFARKAGIKKVVFASSRETYGNAGKLKYKEGDVRIENCESPYTASKIAGESLVQSYRRCYGIDFVIVRFSNVYGMYDDSDRFIPLVIGKAKRNETVEIFGKEKKLDFTYIDDAVNGVVLALEKFARVRNQVFNIAQGKSSTLLAVAKEIIKQTNSKSGLELKPNRTGEVVRYQADTSKVRRLLGYKPKTSTTEGIRKSLEWYGKNI